MPQRSHRWSENRQLTCGLCWVRTDHKDSIYKESYIEPEGSMNNDSTHWCWLAWLFALPASLPPSQGNWDWMNNSCAVLPWGQTYALIKTKCFSLQFKRVTHSPKVPCNEWHEKEWHPPKYPMLALAHSTAMHVYTLCWWKFNLHKYLETRGREVNKYLNYSIICTT
jgi:hypothetical protein